jgi:preprotein translocase subunit SecG
MIILLTIIHVIVCLFLILVVLLQSGKAADLAGAFGGMGSQTVFGPRGSATVLSKATTIAAGLFMVTSITLAIMATAGGGGSVGSTVLERQGSQAQKPAAQSAPAKPPAGGQPPISVTPEGGKTVPLPLPANPGKPKPSAEQPPPSPAPKPTQ